MVCTRADNSDLDAVFRLPSSEAVKDVDVVASVQIINGTLSVDFEGVLVPSSEVSKRVSKGSQELTS